MADPAAIQAKLQVLRDAYAAQLPEKIKQLKQVFSQLRLSQASPQFEWNEEGWQGLYRIVHGLSGSGKTFGFSAFGEVAGQLENYLKPIGAAKRALNEEQFEQMNKALDELMQMSLQPDKIAGELSQITQLPRVKKPRISNKVFVVEDDQELAGELKGQLSYFGYEATVFNTLNDFRNAMQQNSDVVVLMDINFPEDNCGGIRVMEELQNGRDVPVPVFFLTTHNEMEIRLDAVRAGSMAYLQKPVDMGILIDELDKLTSSQSQAANRVLIVDDDVHLMNYYAAALEQAGMLVKMVNDPLKVLQPLAEFSPDLILIDMYMPGCSGMELAKVIRQMNEFVSIPIVFLSSETDQDKQLSAIGMGGDDFLTKPIALQHLISSVTSRIKRSLVLRSFMVRDSLTGLLNHSSIKTQLNHEMVRARRQGKPLAFAMLDIDKFKDVNDTYGHPVGDRVIKSLSRLLKQRLRENDLIGRYGGEEFAVVLSDADGASALKIMDSIRDDFSKLRQIGGDQEFFVTFSCGVADLSNYIFASSSKMVDAADKALYKAKHAGRNRIVLFDDKPAD